MTLQRSQRNRTQTGRVQMPRGLNVADSPTALEPGDALWLVNLLQKENGPGPRLGSAVHATGLAEVRTLIPFAGEAEDGSEDKLFAATVVGLYDVSTATPSLVLSWSYARDSAGFCSFVALTTAAGRYIALCDEQNGYHLFDGTAGTWSKVAFGSGAGEVSVADPATFAHVAFWKERLWFTVRDSSAAYYLPVGVFAGAATVFDFGTRAKNGGHLAGLWDWTLDAGSGVDDHLIAIFSGGDVQVWAGTDPDDATTFALRGVWNLGALPAGRRIATDSGGDLLILSSRGLVPLSRVVSGGEKLDPDAYSTRKIAPLLARYMAARRNLRGWAVVANASQSALMVLMPLVAGQEAEQLAMSLSGNGWSVFRDLRIACGCTYKGAFYFGTDEGDVLVARGHVDNLASDGTGSSAIQFAAVTAYSDLGAPGALKRVQSIRPEFATDGNAPTWTVKARYDLDLSEPADVAYVAQSGGWDSGLWDSAVWGADTGVDSEVVGAVGAGRLVALEVSGASIGDFALVGASVTFDVGGVL